MTEVKLENWSLTVDSVTGYTAPESIKHRLYGNCYGHPLHDDGKEVTTSTIIEGSFEEGGLVTTRSGTKYRLGKMSQEYKDWLDEFRAKKIT